MTRVQSFADDDTMSSRILGDPHYYATSRMLGTSQIGDTFSQKNAGILPQLAQLTDCKNVRVICVCFVNESVNRRRRASNKAEFETKREVKIFSNCKANGDVPENSETVDAKGLAGIPTIIVNVIPRYVELLFVSFSSHECTTRPQKYTLPFVGLHSCS